LEFETRRECYYWILWALDMYRPKVYEMSRLNLESTVLSKRRLIKLVTTKRVRGWDDPRMPTISGLRRRGYTADIINTFCMEVGATRAANVVEMSRLQQVARLKLASVATRVMAALDPIRVVITNFAAPETFPVLNIATDESQGSHTITLTSVIFIDSSDFRLEDHPDYRGLAPKKAVGLKYHGGSLICDEVRKKEDGTIEQLDCHLDVSEGREKPQSHISWAPENSFTAEIRVYNNLFSVAEPSDLWEDELNPTSEIVYASAKVDPSIKDLADGAKVNKWVSGTPLQIERFGYFVVDHETTFNPATGEGAIVLNRTVSLKEEVFKKQVTVEEQAAMADRAAKTKNALAAKEARMKIDPINFFREAEEFQGLYSQFDAESGIPTHDADGVALTKSAVKKLTKEKQKHVNQQEKWNSSKG
jgi:glutaminyl-tRNA synthetase